jgi:hypothetical protein
LSRSLNKPPVSQREGRLAMLARWEVERRARHEESLAGVA